MIKHFKRVDADYGNRIVKHMAALRAMENQKQQIFYIENPLLDISVDVTDDALLQKYGIQSAMASLATPEQLPLYDELWNMEGR